MKKTFPEFKKVITDSRVIMMDGIAINLKQEITMAILRIAPTTNNYHTIFGVVNTYVYFYKQKQK
jgi:hypothetical protein